MSAPSGTSAGHTYVQYFIPYDGDVEEHPNVFIVKKPAKGLTLADVQQAFPLPGTYFFRAKQAFGKTHVWLDMHRLDDVLPVFNGKITLKVSRLAHAGGQGGAMPSGPPTAAVATAARPASKAPEPSSGADMLGLFGGSSSAPTPAPSSAATEVPRPSAAGAKAPAHAPRPSVPTNPASTADDIFAFNAGPAPSPPAAGGRPTTGNGDIFGGASGWGAPAPGGGSMGLGGAPVAGGRGTGAPIGAGRGGPINGMGRGGSAPAPAPAGSKAGGNLLSGDFSSLL